MWLFIALASAAIYGIAETLDNFFANKEFKHPSTLIFYSSLFNLVYVPLLYFVETPELPPFNLLPLFILLGFVNMGYLYPYYRGLKTDDTSIAISFLAVERIMVPVLAFLIVGEVLVPIQYLGILVIVASVIALGLHSKNGHFRMSKAIWFITCAAFFLAVEAVLYKVLLDKGLEVGTVVGGEAFFSLIFGLSVGLFKKVRKDVIVSFPIFKSIFWIFLIEELFTFLGNLTEGYAIDQAPVSIVKGVTMTSPFFLVLYAWIGGGILPTLFKEDLHKKKVIQKLVLFAVLIVGVILVKD